MQQKNGWNHCLFVEFEKNMNNVEKNNIIKTKSHARLKLVRMAQDDKNYNWVFVPGGPGLGSESLTDLTNILDLSGMIWHFDFPGDGSNIFDSPDNQFCDWQKALIESTHELKNIILVCHSSGGMFALATPEIEKQLSGLILMDTAPNAQWQKYFESYLQENKIPEVEKLTKLYTETPSNDLLKQLTILSAPYFAMKNREDKIIKVLQELPFNYKSHQWAEKNFDRTYQAKWIPQKIPTLIFSGDQDHITPLKLFRESEAFQRRNIIICEIKNAGHFPWIDNPEEVKLLFKKYHQWIESIE